MTPGTPWTLSPDRLFGEDPARRVVARELYEGVRDLPHVCPHGHVPPALLADPEAALGTPAELFIIPDHYVFRMLYSQGIPLGDLDVPTRGCSACSAKSSPSGRSKRRRGAAVVVTRTRREFRGGAKPWYLHDRSG